MVSRELVIINRLGLHARAAAKLVSTAGRFSSTVRIERDGKGADAKSIMAVMMLAAGKGTAVTVHTEGDDAVAALEAVAELINDRFGEDE
ncbi:MAG: HPr family phosphocarrier protein [Gammaproteobacteria bacterium]|jgi:phosphocarrier protein HPr|nr:HPr family phosphocarrier protein [Gammaproteobacteria bacterium]HQY69464.1 HPr family phosphocarrier protein [Pseudomonadales bacterium]